MISPSFRFARSFAVLSLLLPLALPAAAQDVGSALEPEQDGRALIRPDRAAPVAVLPSLADHPALAADLGRQWFTWEQGGRTHLDFGRPEDGNWLWTMACVRSSGGARIVHHIDADAPDMGAGDRFGFSLRVDDRASLGMIGLIAETRKQRRGIYATKFYTTPRHPLFPALAQGSRVYVNLNGNRFSIALSGSGEEIKALLQACR